MVVHIILWLVYIVLFAYTCMRLGLTRLPILAMFRVQVLVNTIFTR